MAGASEVAMPVLASTIATMIVFSPVLFLQGKGRFLFTPLAAAVVFSMIASYLVSMTLVPVLSAWFLKSEAESGPKNTALTGHLQSSMLSSTVSGTAIGIF
ncbi:acriflavin resistance protein [mine drainage metagenome]|uniref:Acriflavin resistance protein n=1 Tax=mine drainage metagenome TaxID=410659 RepID=T1BDY9_9ZZZZ